MPRDAHLHPFTAAAAVPSRLHQRCKPQQPHHDAASHPATPPKSSGTSDADDAASNFTARSHTDAEVEAGAGASSSADDAADAPSDAAAAASEVTSTEHGATPRADTDGSSQHSKEAQKNAESSQTDGGEGQPASSLPESTPPAFPYTADYPSIGYDTGAE